MADFIPRRDSEFAVWVTRYSAALGVFYTAHGLDPDELLTFQLAVGAWNTGYTAHVAAQAAAQAARQTKDAARARAESLARPLAAYVQALSFTTDADRATLGITVHGGAALPSRHLSTAPIAQVKEGGRLTHQVRLVDESTPTRRARPRGVLGAEVWVKLVEADQPAPTDPNEMSFLTMTTKPSFRAEFKAAEGGKTAVYMARWINTRGEKGPWSDIATATVAA
jgi:hypothetical protein